MMMVMIIQSYLHIEGYEREMALSASVFNSTGFLCIGFVCAVFFASTNCFRCTEFFVI